MKASDLLVKCLENEGVKYIFRGCGRGDYAYPQLLEGLLYQVRNDKT